MGDIYVTPGGGGADLDAVTAGAGDVLAGKTIVDREGELVAGTMPYRGAWTGRIGVNGRVAIPAGCHNGSGYVDQSIPNNGAQNATLNCGQSKTIPAGYTSGGTVTANSLASQTGGATADTSKVLSGYTFWRDGAKHTGILTVQSVVSFSVAQYSNLTLIASWAKPSRGPWSGLRVMCKQGGYPSNASDGTLFYEGSGTSAMKSLAAGTWYFRAWNYMTTSQGRMYGGYVQGTSSNIAVSGQKTYTSSGTFTVPSYVRTVKVFLVGGGGGGQQWANNGATSGQEHGSGGGGGGYTRIYDVSVTPGQKISVVVGAGGVSNSGGSRPGGASSFGSYSAPGGSAGGYEPPIGGAGGSGGGSGSEKIYQQGGSGGSNGGNGGIAWTSSYSGGKGQGSTTRAFGESSGTVYAGGGAGGGHTSKGVSPGGTGGGGKSGYNSSSPGSANTGGGGGGAGSYSMNPYNGSSGGSGIVLLRWG